MTTKLDRRTASLLAMGGFVALAAIGTAAYAQSAVGLAQMTEPVPCEVVATETGNGMNLEAIYNAQGPASGTYSFSVKTIGSTGSTNVKQGGAFSAHQAGPVSLGRVSVGDAPSYDISLEVEVNGRTLQCLGPNDGWA